MAETIYSVLSETGAELCRLFHSVKVERHGFFIHHKHTALELSLILSGTGLYRTAEEAYPIHAGDVFLYSANEQHCITDAVGLSLLNLHFSPRLFRGTESEARFLDIYYARPAGRLNRIDGESKPAKRVAALFEEIRREAVRADDCTGQMLRAHLTEALVCLYRETALADPSHRRARPGYQSTKKIDRAVDFIDSHFEGELSLDEIAARAHLSRTYFCSLFKDYYGITPWEYINIKRIERAKRLLADTDETVLAVALSSGFNNTANFNRIFRAVTATTPQKYRAYVKGGKAGG